MSSHLSVTGKSATAIAADISKQVESKVSWQEAAAFASAVNGKTYTANTLPDKMPVPSALDLRALKAGNHANTELQKSFSEHLQRLGGTPGPTVPAAPANNGTSGNGANGAASFSAGTAPTADNVKQWVSALPPDQQQLLRQKAVDDSVALKDPTTQNTWNGVSAFLKSPEAGGRLNGLKSAGLVDGAAPAAAEGPRFGSSEASDGFRDLLSAAKKEGVEREVADILQGKTGETAPNQYTERAQKLVDTAGQNFQRLQQGVDKLFAQPDLKKALESEPLAKFVGLPSETKLGADGKPVLQKDPATGQMVAVKATPEEQKAAFLENIKNKAASLLRESVDGGAQDLARAQSAYVASTETAQKSLSGMSVTQQRETADGLGGDFRQSFDKALGPSPETVASELETKAAEAKKAAQAAHGEADATAAQIKDFEGKGQTAEAEALKPLLAQRQSAAAAKDGEAAAAETGAKQARESVTDASLEAYRKKGEDFLKQQLSNGDGRFAGTLADESKRVVDTTAGQQKVGALKSEATKLGGEAEKAAQLAALAETGATKESSDKEAAWKKEIDVKLSADIDWLQAEAQAQDAIAKSTDPGVTTEQKQAAATKRDSFLTARTEIQNARDAFRTSGNEKDASPQIADDVRAALADRPKTKPETAATEAFNKEKAEADQAAKLLEEQKAQAEAARKKAGEAAKSVTGAVDELKGTVSAKERKQLAEAEVKLKRAESELAKLPKPDSAAIDSARGELEAARADGKKYAEEKKQAQGLVTEAGQRLATLDTLGKSLGSAIDGFLKARDNAALNPGDAGAQAKAQAAQADASRLIAAFVSAGGATIDLNSQSAQVKGDLEAKLKAANDGATKAKSEALEKLETLKKSQNDADLPGAVLKWQETEKAAKLKLDSLTANQAPFDKASEALKAATEERNKLQAQVKAKEEQAAILAGN